MALDDTKEWIRQRGTELKAVSDLGLKFLQDGMITALSLSDEKSGGLSEGTIPELVFGLFGETFFIRTRAWAIDPVPIGIIEFFWRPDETDQDYDRLVAHFYFDAHGQIVDKAGEVWVPKEGAGGKILTLKLVYTLELLFKEAVNGYLAALRTEPGRDPRKVAQWDM